MVPGSGRGLLPKGRPVNGRLAAAVASLPLLALLSLGGIVRNGFVNFDDDVYLTANPALREGLTLRALRWAFTTTHEGNWHPLTWVSHMLDVTLFDMNPVGHHAVGLLLHAANGLLLFAALHLLTGAVWPSWLAAALFAAHPLHVESVAWAAERKDLVSTLFELLALLSWVRLLRRRTPVGRATPVVLYALALLAKPMPVTLPFLLLLLDWWPLGRWAPPGAGEAPRSRGALGLLPPAPLWIEKIPFFALAAASGAVTLYAQASSGALRLGTTLPPELRLANAVLSYARYLGRALFPRDLAFLYPLSRTPPPAWQVAGALALLLLLSALALRAAPRRPWLAAGGLWYLVTLLPVIGVVQVGGQAMADRYTYLPLTGPFIALAWSAADAARRRPSLRLPLAAASLALLAALGLRSSVQAAFWRDSATLHRRALEIESENWVAHNHLANALMHEGKAAEALVHYHEAARISGNDPYVLGNVAAALLRLGRIEEAVESYREVLRRTPGLAHARYNLAVALQAAGRDEEAVAEYRRALELKPDDHLALCNLGNLLMSAGRAGEAVQAYRRAFEIDPRFPEARFNLGLALLAAGDAQGAAEHLRAAAALLPSDVGAQMALGDALLRLGRGAEAAEAYRRALEIDPSSREAAAGRDRAHALLRGGGP